MKAVRYVARSGKHHVLEQMRESRMADLFVFGAYVVPRRNGHCWNRMVCRKDHGEAVRQAVGFDRDLDGVAGRRTLCGGNAREDENRDNGEPARFHGPTLLFSRKTGTQESQEAQEVLCLL